MGERVKSKGFALIRISDSGPGIDDAQKENVFHTFHQVRHGKKSHGESLGLGLAISRAIVEAHGGTIWVEDNPEGGAVFFVLLPRAVAEDDAFPSSQRRGGATAAAKREPDRAKPQ